MDQLIKRSPSVQRSLIKKQMAKKVAEAVFLLLSNNWPGPMQRWTGEPREVRKEAAVALICVCRRVPGHFCVRVSV